MQSNPYDILGLKPGVSDDALKRRYRERVRSVHPDLNPNDPVAAHKTRELVEAYKYLSDPEKRAALDARLRAADAQRAPKPPPPKPKPRRPKKATRAKRPRTTPPPRGTRARARTTKRHIENVIIMNGQRIEMSGNGSVNVVMHNSGGYVQTRVESIGDGFAADVTMGSGVMSGSVTGDLRIRPESTSNISGTVMGDVFVASNSRVTVSGTVMGDVHAKGSYLRVLGVVMGDIFADHGRAELLGVHMGDLV